MKKRYPLKEIRDLEVDQIEEDKIITEEVAVAVVTAVKVQVNKEIIKIKMIDN